MKRTLAFLFVAVFGCAFFSQSFAQKGVFQVNMLAEPDGDVVFLHLEVNKKILSGWAAEEGKENEKIYLDGVIGKNGMGTMVVGDGGMRKEKFGCQLIGDSLLVLMDRDRTPYDRKRIIFEETNVTIEEWYEQFNESEEAVEAPPMDWEEVEEAEAVPEKADLPTTSVEFYEDSHNFGEIKEGEKVTHTFKFKNTGSNDLVIENVKPSCGCTTPNWSKDPIPPGEEGFVDVQFDSKGKSGMQKKSVTVVANISPKAKILTFSGEVINE